MTGHALIVTLAIVLGVAAVMTVLSRRLGLSPVLGYLVSGLVVGPNVAVPLYADAGVVSTLSELGVILLMFSIGLELSVRKVRRLFTTAAPVALIEMSLMAVLGWAAARVLGFGPLDGAFVGAMLAISSTMVIAKTYADQGVKAGYAAVVFGVLVFEDLIAIVLLTVLTGLAAGLAPSAASLASTLGKLIGFLVGAVALGLPLVPRLMRRVQAMNSPEATTVAAVGVCFAFAAVAHAAGFSVALGAIIAGVLCAESGHAEALEHQVAPLKDLFSAIFFVSVGMLIEPQAVLAQWLPIVVLTVVVVVGKWVAVTTGAVLAGEPLGVAARAGASMVQIGEFSFILAGMGVASGATSPALLPVAVLVSAITAFVTPYAVARADRIAAGAERRLPSALREGLTLYHGWIERLRTQRSPAPREARRHVRFILVEALGVVIIAGAAAVVMDPTVSAVRHFLLPEAPRWILRGTVGLIAFAACIPFAVGILRHATALARDLAAQLTLREGAAPSGARLAAWRLLSQGFGVALALVIGAPLLAVVLPLLPFGTTLGLLLVVVTLLVLFVTPLRRRLRESRSGAQTVLEAFRRQLRAETHAELPAVTGDTLDGPAEAGMLETLEPFATVVIDPAWPAVGRSLEASGALDVDGVTLLAVLRVEGMVVAPTSDAILAAGDRLVVAANAAVVEELTQRLAGG